jgi:hypothetical protein
MRKRCFREPAVEIFDAARYLDAAVSAHLRGSTEIAKELFALANDPKIREWTESIWGKASQYVIVNKQEQLHSAGKEKERMPAADQMKVIRDRDGFHCRFCGIPVVRAEVRKYFHDLYPDSVPWGSTNESQHAAFQCMWLQYDHVTPHSAGGKNDISNIVITCAACNYGKMNYTLDELGLLDPRDFQPIQTSWDGLERINVR